MTQDKLFGSLHILLCFYNNKIENLGDSMLNPVIVFFIFMSHILLIMLFSFIVLSVSVVLT